MATAITARTGEEIRRDVLAERRRGARVHPNEIGGAVKDGVVTSTRPPSGGAAAHRVRGARDAANENDVRLPGSAERGDADVAAAAVRALEWDAFVLAGRVEATVSRGRGTLRGEVERQYQRQDAERVVRRRAGDEPDHGQAPRDAVRGPAEDRGRCGERGDRRAPDHSLAVRPQPGA
jgi:osmotically-inducible protein OsmY